jgi:hypothetical protein
MVTPSPTILESRDELYKLFPEGQEINRVVEIGVWEGGFAATLLSTLQPRELHLIDPWPENALISSGDQDGRNVKTFFGKELFSKVYNRFLQFIEEGRVIIHRGYSPEALDYFADGSVDLVYIDGDHSYEAVKRDMDRSWPLLREGGVLAGHDLCTNWARADRSYDFGIRQAVDEFCAEHGVKIDYLFFDGCVSFAIIKKRATNYLDLEEHIVI